MFLQLFIALIVASSGVAVAETNTVASDWLTDEVFGSYFAPHCDFPIVDATNLRSFSDLPQWMQGVPIILKNLTHNWAANTRWTKANLLHSYGDRKIKSGSQSSIVHSAGEAEIPNTFRSFLNRMTEISNNAKNQRNASAPSLTNQDSFLFDTSIIYTIPEFTADFTIPSLFADWDSFEEEQEHNMWHMLSIGPTRSGLPFHNHGKTWITIVHGVKHWFVYPVGFGSPIELFLNASQAKDFLVVEDWVKNVFPLLSHLPKPPLQASEHLLQDMYATNKSFGFQPLQCAQRAGDTLFLPSLWSHLTINEGETIGIGGQHAVYDEERYEKSRAAYDLNHRTYEVEKDMGLAIFNTVSSQQDDTREQLQFVGDGVIVMQSEDEVDNLFEKTGNTIVLLREKDENRCVKEDVIVKYAQELKRRIFDQVELDIAVIPKESPRCSPSTSPEDLEILFFPGWSNALLRASDDSGSIPEAILPEPIQIAVASISATADAIVDEFNKADGSFGSVTTVTMLTKIQYKVSLKHFMKALSLRPYSPEAISMVIELAGMSDDFETMINLANSTESFYMNLREHVANTTAASFFHKVARAFMTRGMHEEALPFLKRSIESSESFLPALKNAVSVSAKLHRKDLAQEALQLLEIHAGDEDISEYVRRVGRMT